MLQTVKWGGEDAVIKKERKIKTKRKFIENNLSFPFKLSSNNLRLNLKDKKRGVKNYFI